MTLIIIIFIFISKPTSLPMKSFEQIAKDNPYMTGMAANACKENNYPVK